MGTDVRFGSKADIRSAMGHVRFTPNSDCKSRHAANGHVCFTPESGHVRRKQRCRATLRSRGQAQTKGLKMATWKRLTDTNQRKIDVNVDSIAYLHPFEKHTSIHFIGGEARINVRETPDQIHLADPLRHK